MTDRTSINPLLSVVIPFYQEAGNVTELWERLMPVLKPYAFEVVAVDDGSRDSTFEELSVIAKTAPQLKVIRFAVNAGQTAALAAGIAAARGATIITMDGDLENDPADIPRLLAKLDEGYDVVAGWRQNRWAAAKLTRKLPSYLANALIARVTKVPLHDFGCTLRAYNSAILDGLDLYGNMHRFIPAYAAARGGRIAELPVSFAPRTRGVSKYGMGRIFKVLMDLVVLVFLTKYLARPMHFFGGLGIVSCFLGVAAAAAALALKFTGVRHLVETPLPLFAGVLFIAGLQLLLFGVLAELLSRIYYSTPGKTPHRVRESINLGPR